MATTTTKDFKDDSEDTRLENMTETYGNRFRTIKNGERDTTTWQLSPFSYICSNSLGGDITEHNDKDSVVLHFRNDSA